ncbi:MAG: hypothetical protein ACJAQS_001357 [Porticoccus sp.]|jgi:hypothetical protein
METKVMRSPVPRIGSWYKDLASQAIFEVVALDSKDQTIEIQLLDGEISDYDMESWSMLELISVEEPEDWRNAYDDDHYAPLDIDAPYYADQWNNTIDNVEPSEVLGIWEDA